MYYKIVWEHNKQKYTEYGSLEKMVEVLKFLENHNDYNLVEMTQDE